MVLFVNVICHVPVTFLILKLDFLYIFNCASTYNNNYFFVVNIIIEFPPLLFITYTWLHVLLTAANFNYYPDIPPYNTDIPQRVRDRMSNSPCPSTRETVIKCDHDSSVQFSSLMNVTDSQEIAQ